MKFSNLQTKDRMLPKGCCCVDKNNSERTDDGGVRSKISGICAAGTCGVHADLRGHRESKSNLCLVCLEKRRRRIGCDGAGLPKARLLSHSWKSLPIRLKIRVLMCGLMDIYAPPGQSECQKLGPIPTMSACSESAYGSVKLSEPRCCCMFALY